MKATRQLTLILPSTDPSKSWVARIQAAWQKSVASILETGRLLIEAKGDPEMKGRFEAMVKLKLPFNASTARRLMIIAQHAVISNRAHGHALPPSWRTLYELTKLDHTELAARIEDGTINPKIERKDVDELRGKKRKGRAPKLPKQNHPIDPLDCCTMRVRSVVLDATRNLPRERWDELFAALRDELADCESTAKRREKQ
jgi:hypothetical protein